MNLQSLFYDLFHYVSELKDSEFSTVSFNEFREEVLIRIKEIRNRSGSLDKDQVNTALFAVVAWIDELVQNSMWEGKKEWQHRFLQTEFFNTTDAGKEFFIYLSKIPPKQVDLFRIFYRCLTLGFRGEYHSPLDKPDLIKYKAYALEHITPDHEMVDNVEHFIAFPEGYECKVGGKMQVGRSPWKRWFLWLIPIPVLLLIYFFFYFVINNTVDNYLQMIK
ncbi:hypothetical protein B1207_12185 [Legionella quinlivanii]|uniref:Type IV / VI secretion system DotU domain-containing protein n=1 Tax=Legionella quinlivanii TaxID=45073 RepID=A0A364LGT9_9GAMM|nr:DotU family type IV/VI secretion system protein [Legionella quinlivanii]RAP35456.1 hypothetical protein B1207_12185 [Legionella quinlivanii]